MRQNQEARIAHQKVLAQEREEVLARQERMRLEDLAVKEAREKKVEEVIAQVKISNAQAIEIKAERVREEIRVQEEVTAYQRKKIIAEEAAIRKAKALAAEKEREIQRLREAQEKAADRQSEID